MGSQHVHWTKREFFCAERTDSEQQRAHEAFERALGARDALRWVLTLSERQPAPAARTSFVLAGVRSPLHDAASAQPPHDDEAARLW